MLRPSLLVSVSLLLSAKSCTDASAETTPVQVINRFCSSGLMACQAIANEIRNGEIEIGLAVGFEDMTAK